VIVVYLLALLGLMALAFVVVDIVPRLRQWIGRIHIGRWKDASAWLQALQRTCESWLERTPIVPFKEQDRMILLDILKGEYHNSTIQYWQRAGLILGLSENDEKLQKNAISSVIDEQTGQWKTMPKRIDCALLAYAILTSKDADVAHIKPAMDAVYKLIREYKGDGQTVPYRKGQSDIRFVDTLGFICPFLMAYTWHYGTQDSEDLAWRQMEEYDIALLPKWYFPAHAYDLKQQAPLGLYDWGRGMGWYALALIEMYKFADEMGKNRLKTRILRLSDSLMQCQQKGGGFSAELFSKSNAEGSATVLAGLLLHQAYCLTQDAKYKEATRRAVSALMSLTRRNGALDMCQGDTRGIGFYSSRFDVMPFAQGLALMLAKRINQ